MTIHPPELKADPARPASRPPPAAAARFRYLHMIDAFTLFGLMVAITVVRFGFDWPTYPPSHYLGGFAVAVAIHMTVYYFGGLYEYEQRLGRPPWLPRATVLTAVAVGIDGAVALLTGRYLMPRINLVVLLAGASTPSGLQPRAGPVAALPAIRPGPGFCWSGYPTTSSGPGAI